MISKTKIAYIRSLHNKSARHTDGVFLVEGRKCINEFLNSAYEIVEGFFTEKFSLDNEYKFPVSLVTDGDLNRMSTLSTNDTGILVVRMRSSVLPKIDTNELVLVLDSINDPGNLGTIIRIADWYGIDHIIASEDTVDCYNTKVLMASMGSFSRVSIFYTNIDQYLSRIEGIIYGAYLDGESVHIKNFTKKGSHLIIGSEAHGISPKLEKYISDKITIPRFGQAESLNAGVATAIILDRIIGSRNIDN